MDHTVELAELLYRHGFRRHAMSRNRVGHLQMTGELEKRPVVILVDTGAASTVVDLTYCRSKGIATKETDHLGGGAGGVFLPIHTIGDVPLTLDGLPLRTDGIYAIDLSHVNEGLEVKGAGRVHVVLGADVLTHHRAAIDYATMSLFLHHGGI